ncbi:serine/threonine protein kinase [Nonomuraea sp. NN258]|uniref:serine/threonine-protein kinase n=1 Tax=Nonomuraea antri TaxID=2730852 RepID=UPI001568C41B|nr:serine/threonine-protein kinase [Nonomuraea antri]NRQ39683.1 serine/threonine protein kinase [Nonomuraea antri]
MVTPDFIGPYRLIRPLGEGGQGVVHLAEAPDGTRVAIKVLHEGMTGDGRFAKEIAALRRVEPFCVAQVLDASLGARPYIVTEYVEGPPLSEAGRHAGADLQRLAVATATALAAVHRAGVVHRDFKPANVLLGRDGPRVIDFGIARAVDSALTHTSSVFGTPTYMAPEQFAGAPVGPATDVFAWGSVMVFAATGRPPFGNDSVPAVLNRVMYEPPRLDGVPEPLRAIVSACLAKDPAARPAMQDVLFQLIGAQPPGSAPRPVPPPVPPPVPQPVPPLRPQLGPQPVPPPPPGPRPGRGTPALVAGGVALAVTGAVVAATIWWPFTDRPSPTGTAAAVLPDSSASTTGSSAAPPRRTSRPRPSGTRTGTRPKTTTATKTPAPAPTTSRPVTSEPATPKPTATRTGGGGAVRSFAFTYEGDQMRGGCWHYTLNIYASVSATGPYTYRWIVNGQNQGRESGSAATRPLLPTIVWKRDGAHSVVFEILTPQRVRKSFTVNICGFDEFGY